MLFAMRFSLFHVGNRLPILICALLCCVVNAEAGKCSRTYCSQQNNQQFLDQNCCTFGSASECGCCLPDKHGSGYHSYPSGCNNSDEYPTWESCVNDWKNCCLAGTGGVLGKQGQRPLYSGVDFADGASCCQLCNGGNWGPSYVKVNCDPNTVPQLLCNSKHEGDNIMLRHEVNAEE
mmetsp:Transcript_2517/g.3609  ORF Transcript_2517/g.3609 Transcript_2517/m.3609 type:complete len:177 (-) Transcript_2517:474-1004(-)